MTGPSSPALPLAGLLVVALEQAVAEDRRQGLIPMLLVASAGTTNTGAVDPLPALAELCRREGIAEGLYYSWSKEFLEAGKRRLAGDTARAATSSEVTDLRREARALKEVVAEQALELRLLKKSMVGAGGDGE